METGSINKEKMASQQPQVSNRTINRKRKKERKRELKSKTSLNASDDCIVPDYQVYLSPLLQKLQSCPDNATIQILVTNLQPSNVELYEALKLVKQDLSRVLSTQYLRHEIFDFGSTISGMAFKDSDFDFFVNYTPINGHQDSMPRGGSSKFIHMTEAKMQRQKTFKDIVKILSAKVPLLRAVHTETNITCDINFSNSRGCYNSKFIYLATRFDERIHHLAVILKCWAKCTNILGKHRQMNTYCLMMMLIFYLQTIKNPLLPSVKNIQSYAKNIEYGPWNLGIPQSIRFASKNNMSTLQLLQGFMKFYANLDWETVIISPFLGRLINRKDVEERKVQDLDVYYDAVENMNFKEISLRKHICIQDPFELNINCGSVCTSPQHFEQIKISFKHALELLSLQKPKERFSIIMVKLFTDVHIVDNSLKKKRRKSEKFITNIKMDDRIKICKLNPLEYELFYTKGILLLREQDKSKIISETDIKKFWNRNLVDFIEDILEKIYFMKLSKIPDDGEKPENPDEEIISYQMTTNVNVFGQRKRIQFSNQQELQQEILVSKMRYDQKQKIEIDCLVNFVINTKTNDSFEIRFQDNLLKSNSLKFFFTDHFLTNIRNCLKGYFMILAKKVNEVVKTNPDVPKLEETSAKNVDKTIICKLNPLECELFYIKTILLLRETDKTKIISEVDMKKFWRSSLQDFIEDILEKIYFMKLTKNADKISKNAEEEIKNYQMTAEVNVFGQRKKIQFSNHQELQQEIQLSKTRHEQAQKIEIDSSVDFIINTKTDDSFEIRFHDNLKKGNGLQNFTNHFIQNIRNCLKGYFLILTKTVEAAGTKKKTELEKAKVDEEMKVEEDEKIAEAE